MENPVDFPLNQSVEYSTRMYQWYFRYAAKCLPHNSNLGYLP
jgi:hypothetical protein